ncbi:hypothetical protein Q3H58_005256 [Pseudomonas psychrotolerans]|nr:hypothetical protein [Pseudomonas psychrotolerans]
MAGIVDVHRMHQQEVRGMRQAQVLGVVEQVGIRVVIGVVEVPVLDRQAGVADVPVPCRLEGGAVVEFAHPVIGRGGGGEPGGLSQLEETRLVGEAIHAVVDDAAAHRRYAGEQAFVEWTGERRQLALQPVEATPAGQAQGLEEAESVFGDSQSESVQDDQDDLHGVTAAC